MKTDVEPFSPRPAAQGTTQTFSCDYMTLSVVSNIYLYSLANSRIGLVLVTPALLARLPKESVADKVLSALLAGNQLVPIVHNTTYEALRNVSPLLASRTGLDTAEDHMAVVATKIAELVAV